MNFYVLYYNCCISGNYTCEVEWGGSPISITHKLTVLVPPSIEAVLPGGLGQVDHPIEAREGSQVRLECRAEGIPPPIVRWRSPVSNNFNCIGNSDSHMFLASFISTKLMLCLHFWFLL